MYNDRELEDFAPFFKLRKAFADMVGVVAGPEAMSLFEYITDIQDGRMMFRLRHKEKSSELSRKSSEREIAIDKIANAFHESGFSFASGGHLVIVILEKNQVDDFYQMHKSLSP